MRSLYGNPVTEITAYGDKTRFQVHTSHVGHTLPRRFLKIVGALVFLWCPSEAA